jgi:hypothetical protein
LRVSIFTPTHDTKFLPEVYDSIKDQDFYEWIIVYNNGAVPLYFNDTRVKGHYLNNAPEWVGPLKAYACEKAEGDILLELDHDDLLMPTAVDEVKEAFLEKDVGFAYSNTVHSTLDFNPVRKFSEIYGWKYRLVNFKGHILDEHISYPTDPNSLSRIWFSPHHLRAFRKDIYDRIGGYNKKMRVLDDHDLMCRMYQTTKFKHIDKGLYVYRVHGENTYLRFNAEIQNNVYRIYDQYIEDLVLRWCDLNNLRKIDLGARFNNDPRYESVDIKEASINCDLNGRWPFEDGTIGVIRANDILEHLKEPVFVMKEIYRVLATGGFALIKVPSTDGRGAFQDPTHVSFWNQNSFLYYTNFDMAKYIDSPVRFQATRLYTTPKTDQEICWVVAHLTKMADGYRPPGPLEI